MTILIHRCLLFCTLTSFTAASSFLPCGWVSRHRATKQLHSAREKEQEEEPSLVLGDSLNKELSKIKSKYPTSEADYLAAARARAQAKVQSTNSLSSDEDWQELQKRKPELVDDWEYSLEEAGNADSQILMPDLPEAGEDEGEGPEPKLLLF